MSKQLKITHSGTITIMDERIYVHFLDDGRIIIRPEDFLKFIEKMGFEQIVDDDEK